MRISDWSSDVCSSDLLDVPVEIAIFVLVPVVAGTAIAARLPGIITLPVEPAFAGGKTPLESATLLPPVARQPALPLTALLSAFTGGETALATILQAFARGVALPYILTPLAGGEAPLSFAAILTEFARGNALAPILDPLASRQALLALANVLPTFAGGGRSE